MAFFQRKLSTRPAAPTEGEIASAQSRSSVQEVAARLGLGAQRHEASSKFWRVLNAALAGWQGRGLTFLQQEARSARKKGAEAASSMAVRSQAQERAFALKVSVLPPTQPDFPAVRRGLDRIEAKRGQAEEALFKQARTELRALASVVVDTLRQALADEGTSRGRWQQPGARGRLGSGRIALLQRGSRARRGAARAESELPPRANVRVTASEVAFPRIGDLVQAMELRRDRTEDAERARILELELSLLRALNDVIKEAIVQAKHTKARH